MKNILFLFLFTLIAVGCRSDEPIKNNPRSPEVIELQTKSPTFISQVQVDYEGEIIKTNDEEILLYGMLIGDKESLTVDTNLGHKTKEYSKGDKIFKGSFYDLNGNTKYYLRFYVKTKNTIYYGNIINFESKKHHSPSEDYIYLNTQQKVDDFGQNKYTYVSNLTIGGDVMDLSPLSSIIKIGKNLDIEDTSKLTKLHGLGNLQIIGTDQFPNGRLQILNNSKLETLAGLDKLMFTGRLLVAFNPSLNNLQGLGRLEQAWHSTFLTVPSFDGLPLNFRTGEFESRGFQGTDLGNRTINCEAYSFTLKDAPNITTMKGFIIGNYQNTTTFKLENCNNLKTLEGIVFPSKYDRIIIINCENFESLKGLDNLTMLGGLSLTNLPKLKRLEGLEKLAQLEGIYLNNIGISNSVGLNNIKTLESLSVSECNNLINFEGLPQLTKIGGFISYFELSSCNNLENFIGLEKVQHFTRFNINNLPKLKSFEGIRQAKMPYISIQYCNLISSLQGLENVHGVGNIAISENQNLQNFCAIKNIVGSLNPNAYYVNNNLSNPTQEDIRNNCQ